MNAVQPNPSASPWRRASRGVAVAAEPLPCNAPLARYRSRPLTELAAMPALGLAVLLLLSPAVGGDAVVAAGAAGIEDLATDAHGSEAGQLAALAELQQQAAADRDRLQQALATLEARLTAIEQQGGLAGLIAAQTEVIADLYRRLEATAPNVSAVAGADAGASAVADVSAVDGDATGSPLAGQGQVTDNVSTADANGALADEVSSLRANLVATERRLQLLIEQFASAQQLREQATAQATDARAQLAEMNARQQQARLELQEAQLRADKAEKRYAALEQVHERGVTERERLSAELDTTRERLAKSLKHTLTLDTRLANAEARVAQLTGGREAPASAPAPAPAPVIETARPGEPVAEPLTEMQTALKAASQAAIPIDLRAQPPAAGAVANGVLPTSDAPPGTGVNGRAEPSRTGSAATKPTPAAAPTGTDRRPAVYAVRADDSLSKISAKVYGNAANWPRIYEANRDVLDTPDQLAPGMMLVIP